MLFNRLKWNVYLVYHLWGQAQFPFKPLEVIKKIQSRRVQRIVSYAYKAVPYYRETMRKLGLVPEDFKTVDDLSKLPVLEGSQIQRDPAYFVSTRQPISNYIKLQSGGSTGEPRTIYYNPSALFLNSAYGERGRSVITSLVGKSLGYRVTVFTSPLSTSYKIHRFIQNHTWFPPPLKIQCQYLSLYDSPKKNVPLMNEFKPEILISYGSYLQMLFSYLEDARTFFHHPLAIMYSSDGLCSSIRRLIQERFGIPVFGHYGAVEALSMGFECPSHLGLHVNMDFYPIRIVNKKGETLPVNECGDLIVSNLINYATVLLNYHLGDKAAAAPDQCPCGRTLPLILFPQGRTDDILKSESGESINPNVIYTCFDSEESVRQYKIVQEDAYHFKVYLIATETCDCENLRQRVTTKFKNHFGENVNVDIRFVDSIDRTKAGKLKVIVSMQNQ